MADQPTRTRTIAAIVTVVLLLLLAFAAWFLTRNAILVARVVIVLIALFLARLVLLTGLRVYLSNPYLTLNDEGVSFAGWWPKSDPGNWNRTVEWDEIAYARAFAEGANGEDLTLQFYGRDDPDAVLADLHHVDRLEDNEGLLALIELKTGVPVMREAPPSGEEAA